MSEPDFSDRLTEVQNAAIRAVRRSSSAAIKAMARECPKDCEAAHFQIVFCAQLTANFIQFIYETEGRDIDVGKALFIGLLDYFLLEAAEGTTKQ